jgi:hypothetical protein
MRQRLFNILKGQYGLTDSSQIRIWKSSFNFTKAEHIRDFLISKNIGGPHTQFLPEDPA